MGKWGSEVLLAHRAALAPAFPPALPLVPRPSSGWEGFCVCPRGLPLIDLCPQGPGHPQSHRSCWNRTQGGCQRARGQDPSGRDREGCLWASACGRLGQVGGVAEAVPGAGHVDFCSYTFILLS